MTTKKTSVHPKAKAKDPEAKKRASVPPKGSIAPLDVDIAWLEASRTEAPPPRRNTNDSKGESLGVLTARPTMEVDMSWLEASRTEAPPPGDSAKKKRVAPPPLPPSETARAKRKLPPPLPREEPESLAARPAAAPARDEKEKTAPLKSIRPPAAREEQEKAAPRKSIRPPKR